MQLRSAWRSYRSCALLEPPGLPCCMSSFVLKKARLSHGAAAAAFQGYKLWCVNTYEASTHLTLADQIGQNKHRTKPRVIMGGNYPGALVLGGMISWGITSVKFATISYGYLVDFTRRYICKALLSLVILFQICPKPHGQILEFSSKVAFTLWLERPICASSSHGLIAKQQRALQRGHVMLCVWNCAKSLSPGSLSPRTMLIGTIPKLSTLREGKRDSESRGKTRPGVQNKIGQHSRICVPFL